MLSARSPDTVEFEVFRAKDGLHLRFTLTNFFLADGPALLRSDVSQPALIVIEFGPQHLAERSPSGDDPFHLPAPVRLSGPTRLGFRLPDPVTQVSASLGALLDWEAWEPMLVPVALAPGSAPDPIPDLRAPADNETAIELPYRLLLSPDDSAQWVHVRRPAERGRRTELWQTRTSGSVRAVWSPDVNLDPHSPPPRDPGFTTTLQPADRHEIVHQSANFGLTSAGEEPAPVDATLMLGATGGWLRALGDWSASSSGLDLVQWEHHATEGRDNYVRTVRRGVLMPFGHKAAYVTIAERRVIESPHGPTDLLAALEVRSFIVVLEPERLYDASDYQYSGREFPFSTGVRFITQVTPDIDQPQLADGFSDTFWVMSGTGYLPLALEGIDHDGRPAPFRAPCLFVGQEDLWFLASVAENVYRAAPEAARTASLDGRRIAFAPALDAGGMPAASGRDGSAGHADLLTATISLDVQTGDSDALPAMSTARVSVPALTALGSAAQTTIRLHQPFLDQGLGPGANPLELFAEATSALPFAFPADRSAGLATPSIDVDGLSRLRGPVGDIAGLAAGSFRPEMFFGDAKLLGGVKLSDLVDPGFDAGQVPKIVSTRLPRDAAVPTSVLTSLDWTPAIAGNRLVTWNDPPAGHRSLELHASSEVSVGSASPATVTAALRAFVLSIPSTDSPYVGIGFDELRCELNGASKPHITATIAEHGLTFGGPLSFINELRTLLPEDGFSDPPALDLTPSGLEVGYTLSLPPVSVGVFDLHGLSLSASLHLPFTGEPARLRVSFSERAHPCVLTVSLFGGGAFLAIAAGTDGIEAIEGALEFGGSFELSLIVATGGVTVMAGVYFKYDRAASPDLTLAGYLRASGELSVLGLISVSVDFMLSLGYSDVVKGASHTGEVEGEATLMVKVAIAFFSKSVGLRLHREFRGASADPSFVDLIATEADWGAYTGAFA